MSPTLFEPDTETAEGWRATPLGALACALGWHFGQVAIREEGICARCEKRYIILDSVDWCSTKYLRPRCSRILYKWAKKGDLRDLFEGYSCLDCTYVTESAQQMLTHQRLYWHNWRTWWARLKDS